MIMVSSVQKCTLQSILAKALSSSLLNLFRPVARHIEWGGGGAHEYASQWG